MYSCNLHFRIVLIGAAALAIQFIASSVIALTIDDFNVGPIEVSRNGATAAAALQTGLDPNHVLGGSRDIIVGEFGATVQSLVIDSAAGELRFSTGTDGAGYFKITYGTMAKPLNIDLTADDSNSFLFETAYVVPNFPATVPPNFITVTTATGTGSTRIDANGADVVVLPDGSRRTKVPFSTLGNQSDLTAVLRIELHLVRMPSGSQFILRTFQTVPEPASIVLLIFGALAITAGMLRWRLNRHFLARSIANIDRGRSTSSTKL